MTDTEPRDAEPAGAVRPSHATRPGPTPTRPASVSHAARVIGLAMVAALATWTIALALGVEPTAMKGGGPSPVTGVDVVVAAIIAGLGAWVASALLARRRRARWWPFLGSTLISISMIGPGYQADGASAVVLCVLHLVVGAVLVAGFAHVEPRADTR